MLTLSNLPDRLADADPALQGFIIAVLTLVQEDAPAIGSALLAASGTLGWKTAFLGSALGIWIGDALLYLVARLLGRRLLKGRWISRLAPPDAIQRAEDWFHRNGTWYLVVSRFLPGSRLPTYVAAGLLRWPLAKFLAVTGGAVLVWTSLLFGLAFLAGQHLLAAFHSPVAKLAAAAGTALTLFYLARALSRVAGRQVLAQNADRSATPETVPVYPPRHRRLARRLGTALAKLQRWEFWPAWLFYLPVAANYLRLAVRHRGFTVSTAANPGIFSGGLVGESKWATLSDLQQTSPEFTVGTWLIDAPTPQERIRRFDQLRSGRHLDFPLILKPDVGQRGAGVRRVHSASDAHALLAGATGRILLQRLAPGPLEAGIFYYRHPGAPRGRIFAITEKVFPTVLGDGRHSIEDLIWADDRARFMADVYLRRLGDRRHEIPTCGEVVRLVEAGNHAQGCIFRDGSHLWTPALEESIDRISRRLDGFYIGRYDIRHASCETLRDGTDFQIIELNGAASEATSLYDARNSLADAYRTLFRQWELVFEIGAANRRAGVEPTGVPVLLRSWFNTHRLIATYPVAD